jgi:hypothetical protein
MRFITEILPAILLFVALMGGVVKVSNIGNTPETIDETWIPALIDEHGVIIMRKEGAE